MARIVCNNYLLISGDYGGINIPYYSALLYKFIKSWLADGLFDGLTCNIDLITDDNDLLNYYPIFGYEPLTTFLYNPSIS